MVCDVFLLNGCIWCGEDESGIVIHASPAVGTEYLNALTYVSHSLIYTYYIDI